jgi:hypothetical protein
VLTSTLRRKISVLLVPEIVDNTSGVGDLRAWSSSSSIVSLNLDMVDQISEFRAVCFKDGDQEVGAEEDVQIHRLELAFVIHPDRLHYSENIALAFFDLGALPAVTAVLNVQG